MPHEEHSQHTLSSFGAELDQLRIDLIQMGNLVLRAVDGSVNGLLSQNIERCSDVIDDDELIDQKQKEIDSRGMSILLRYSPMASDFRAAVSALSVCRSLERVGDYAVNISKSARKLLKHRDFPEINLVNPLFEATRNQLSEALLAYTNADSQQALQIIKGDKQIDKLHKKLSKTLTAMVDSGGCDVKGILHLLFISRFLERIGDLAANIGEDVVFISSAEDIRHG